MADVQLETRQVAACLATIVTSPLVRVVRVDNGFAATASLDLCCGFRVRTKTQGNRFTEAQKRFAHPETQRKARYTQTQRKAKCAQTQTQALRHGGSETERG